MRVMNGVILSEAGFAGYAQDDTTLQRSTPLTTLRYDMTLTPADDESDPALIVAVAAGDEAAFRLLYRRHTPKLRGLVLRILGGQPSEADDIVQDTWLRAVGSIRQFRGESSFGSWLNGIGVRVT